MATTLTTPATTAPEGQCVEWHGLDWKGYRALLRLRGERSSPRIIYLDGRVYLVSPAYRHERPRKLLGLFVMVVVEELKIPCIQAGSTTFRRRNKRGGVEGDQTYYLANATRILGKDEIDLRIDPPPDLAIEVVNTRAASAALEVYRRLGVPEVWICEDAGLRFLVLQPNGDYAEAQSSPSMPFLSPAEIFSWVGGPQIAFDSDWAADLRRWVQETLLPRRAGFHPPTV